MRIDTATRRANFWLFLGLVAFAIAFCIVIFLWMRSRTHEQGGKVYPPVGAVFSRHPALKMTKFLKVSAIPKARKTPVEILPAYPLISPFPEPILL